MLSFITFETSDVCVLKIKTVLYVNDKRKFQFTFIKRYNTLKFID